MRKILSGQERRRLERENKQWPLELTPIPKGRWPLSGWDENRIEVWRSYGFLVQVFTSHDASLRMSVCRTEPDANGEWVDGITWDELQRLKREIGRADFYAVEVYPPDAWIVNVANMRHLWLHPEPMTFGWNPENNPECGKTRKQAV